MFSLIIFLSLLQLALSTEWDDSTYKCEFKEDLKKLYICSIADSYTMEGDDTRGKHLDGKTNNDVESVAFQFLNLDFPKDTFQRFPGAKHMKISFMEFEDAFKGGLFVKSGTLEDVVFNFNKMPTIGSNAFDFAPNCKKLNLRANYIKNVDKDAFKGLQLLEEMDISRNEIETLHVGTFDDLVNLKSLMADYNPLNSLSSGLFKNNGKLITASFFKAKLTYIDPELVKELPIGTFLGVSQNTCIDETYSKGDLSYAVNVREQEEFIEKISTSCKL